jgi:uncharacterized membrane protein
MELAAATAPVEIRRVGVADVLAALRGGVDDFNAAPLFGLFFGGVYCLGGWLIVLAMFGFNYYYLAYPLAMGFALNAPFVCAGVYEVSRELERGRTPQWDDVLGAVWGRTGLLWLGLVSLFTLVIWVDIAWLVAAVFYGLHMPDLREFMVSLFTTADGLIFFVIGNLVGAAIAVTVFSITVVAPTLIVDRELDFVTAMIASVRAVVASPGPMILWAAIIGGLLTFSIATGFLALFVVLPILGHASWRLYRRVVV